LIKQEKLLENLRTRVDELSGNFIGNSMKDETSLMNFVLSSFDAVVESSQKYIKLFHDLSRTYAKHLNKEDVRNTNDNQSKNVDYLIKLQERNYAENKERLSKIYEKCKEVGNQFSSNFDFSTHPLKRDIMMDELQRRYTDSKNRNFLLMKIIEKHGLTNELCYTETKKNTHEPLMIKKKRSNI